MLPALGIELQAIFEGRDTGRCQEKLFTKSGSRLGLEELATPVLVH